MTIRNHLILLAITGLAAGGVQAAATHARPGRITDQELEKEGGGAGLRYSFEVLSHGRTYKVGVDARTGRVLENKAEGGYPD